MMPISQGRAYWFGTANAREGERDGPVGRKYDVLQRFAGWHPSVVEWLRRPSHLPSCAMTSTTGPRCPAGA